MNALVPRKRAYPTYPKALAVAEAEVISLIGEDVGEGRARAVARLAASAYMTALQKTGESGRGQHYGRITKALAAMRVGDVLVVETTSSVLHKYCRPARKLMSNLDAKWSTDSLADGKLEVCRLPDGESRDPKTFSPVVARLVAMNVGDSALMPELGRPESFTVHYKARARRQMGVPTADWSRRTTTKGVRVTRTA